MSSLKLCLHAENNNYHNWNERDLRTLTEKTSYCLLLYSPTEVSVEHSLRTNNLNLFFLFFLFLLSFFLQQLQLGIKLLKGTAPAKVQSRGKFNKIFKNVIYNCGR